MMSLPPSLFVLLAHSTLNSLSLSLSLSLSVSLSHGSLTVLYFCALYTVQSDKYGRIYANLSGVV